MKRKTIIAMILALGIISAGAVTYQGFAFEKDKKEAETIAIEARTQAQTIQEERDQALIQEWSEKVYPGVTVMGLDLSGKTLGEAQKSIQTDLLDKVKKTGVVVKAREKEFTITYGELDIALDAEKLAQEALSIGKDLKDSEKLQRIEGKEAVELTLEFTHNTDKIETFVKQVESQVNQEAKEATISFSGGDFKVTDHADGLIINEEKLLTDLTAALSDLAAPKTVEAEIVVSHPRVTSEDLKEINGQLASYTTYYGSSIENRKYNVAFAASKINGTVLLPGETFSYNKEVGAVTLAAGFKNAGVFVGNKVEDGVGGGLCQVSSTLYQAVLHSNLNVVQRRNHSMAVAYLNPGMDAVVYSPSLDLKFTNNYDSPVYVYAYGANGKLTVAIYGDTQDLGGKTYKVFSETTAVLQPQTIRVADNTLYVGEEVVDQKPVTGYKSKTYRQTLVGGKVVATEVISQDSYKKVDKIVRYGTKERPATVEPVETPAP
ncbi:VanW family protein [Proteiniclasticum sp. BAD-10]|uniref:VanW family protein n=1 Tax=Proteiniclasticum sediminis TaxID=2804028 RepID=A0A941HRE9_9CLOT|nr:VanW family protein [Proteiniclasticum sediminis]MBR0576162.1 VanW family protein [Proteiniclasticum sediminis]